MADPTLRDILAELTTLRIEVATLKRKRRQTRLLPLSLVALFVALMPLALLAATPFSDLTGGVHDANIGFIYDAGVTKGCVPDAEYCPTATVTRQEMASFLARLGGLGTNPPVANALTAVNATNAQNAAHTTTADTATSATNATNAATAGNANTVGGYAPDGLVRVARNTNTAIVTIMGVYGFGPQTPLVSLTITAPTAGFVLVSGATVGEAQNTACNGSPTGQACTVIVRLRDTATDGTNSPYLTTVVNRQAGGNWLAALSPTYVFPVTAGPHTFVLEGATDLSFVGWISALNSTITALFVPFGSTGGSTLDVP